MPKTTLGLFEAFGIELEYMVVDRDTLRPLPLAEQVLVDAKGNTVNEISLGNIDVSNELATHVLELKSSGPVADLDQLERDFHQAILEMNRRLAKWNAMLAPGGIHPFMDPRAESSLWSKGDRSIYEAYNRIFDCHRHGWLNLQSCHLNLPFANEEEFGRLHAAIIIILPYLSALSASSPFIEGKHEGFLDTRLKVYSRNQAKVPEIAGHIVPEPVFTYADYQTEILDKLYRAIAPHDPKGLLQYEWLNSRGAIARFDRNAIEIRVLDTQECPQRDLAICRLIIALLQKLCSLDSTVLLNLARRYTPEERHAQFMKIAEHGSSTTVALSDVREALDIKESGISVGEFWLQAEELLSSNPLVAARKREISSLLANGSLSQRLLHQYGESPQLAELQGALATLSNRLRQNEPYSIASPV